VHGADDTVVDGDIAYNVILGSATSADSQYNGRDPADVTLKNIDNDSIPLVKGKTIQIKTHTVKGKPETDILITFTGDLLTSSAKNLSNYRLAAAGKDKKFGTKDDVVTKLKSAAYDSHTRTVTLIPAARKLPQSPALQLRIKATGVVDAMGRPIDGNHDGN